MTAAVGTALKEVLCGRLPAVLQCPDLHRSMGFYAGRWGFGVAQSIPGVMAVLVRESVTVQLLQRRADESPQPLACRLLVDCMDQWWMQLYSAPGQTPHQLVEQRWGTEWAISDCDGNRLLLVQSAPHLARRQVQRQVLR